MAGSYLWGRETHKGRSGNPGKMLRCAQRFDFVTFPLVNPVYIDPLYFRQEDEPGAEEDT